MIAVTGGMRVLVATRPVDFRKGMDGLAAVVKEHLKAEPYSGAIFVFRAKRADRVKLIRSYPRQVSVLSPPHARRQARNPD